MYPLYHKHIVVCSISNFQLHYTEKKMFIRKTLNREDLPTQIINAGKNTSHNKRVTDVTTKQK